MKKRIIVFTFAAVVWCLPLYAAEPKISPPIPKEVVAILTEVNAMLKTRETKENLGFIARTPIQEIYPMGFFHITGQTKTGTAFVIDVYIAWINPQEDKFLIPFLVAGKSVPSVWWWKKGKMFKWKVAETEEDAPELSPPAKTPTKGNSI